MTDPSATVPLRACARCGTVHPEVVRFRFGENFLYFCEASCLSEWGRLRGMTGTAGTTHRCPPDGDGLMPCCGLTPFEVPRTGRITEDGTLVTCRAPGETWPDPETLGVLLEAGLRDEGAAGRE